MTSISGEIALAVVAFYLGHAFGQRKVSAIVALYKERDGIIFSALAEIKKECEQLLYYLQKKRNDNV